MGSVVAVVVGSLANGSREWAGSLKCPAPGRSAAADWNADRAGPQDLTDTALAGSCCSRAHSKLLTGSPSHIWLPGVKNDFVAISSLFIEMIKKIRHSSKSTNSVGD